MSASFKVPESVLVVIHSADLQVLLIERTDAPGFWQSVTGSKDFPEEDWALTARRELAEETGIVDGELTDWQLQNRYEIYPRWQHRYAPGVTHNLERVFGLQLPATCTPTLNPREHSAFVWLPWQEAAERCFSPSNAEAILQLPARCRREP